ncbi:MAG: hypothetical protein GC179_06740 [Anaerolineaceae bacterium]|nr:hypothetical protein [Anaerolineaceae bacterium]
MSKRRADWIDDDEYPDDRDVEDFGEDSPVDYDRRTIGRAGSIRQPFWTRTRIFIIIIFAVLLFSFIFAEVIPLFQR